MANKEYVALFVERETRNRIKKLAITLGYPSMIAFVKSLSTTSSVELRELLK